MFTKENRLYITFHGGVRNGTIVSLFNTSEDPVLSRPGQVYLTTVKPGMMKGPHLHKERTGRFACVHGEVLIVVRDDKGEYHQCWSGEHRGIQTVTVPFGMAAAIYNVGVIEAKVIVMPTEPWNPDDEWEITDWSPPVDWVKVL